jgi:endogenous inhibitor of DNA gyrase (YacG/DUF329 family)
MNTQQKNQIASLRREGYGYTKIAQALGLSKNTVKSYCRRNDLSGIAADDPHVAPIVRFCPECGKEIIQAPHRKEKKFCSDECRHKWWNARPEMITRKAVYSYTCAHCGEPFTAYGNSHRKYCSHACYIADRFKGGDRND